MSDGTVFVIWALVSLAGAVFTGWAVTRQLPQIYLALLIGLIALYLVTDAVYIGGFHMDGVTSIPVFFGILASLGWIVVWIIFRRSWIMISAAFGCLNRIKWPRQQSGSKHHRCNCH